MEQYLLPDLPMIVGKVDYQTLRAQLSRMHQLLVDGGIERDFIARSINHRRGLGETDDGVIIDWKLIREQARSDCHQVEPSLSRVQDIFPERIKGIVTDRGCDSKDNVESLALELIRK